VSWLLGVQIVLYALYVAYVARRRASRAQLAQDVRASLWLIGFYALVLTTSWLGTFDGRQTVEGPWDSLLVAAIALVVYYWGERSGVPYSRIPTVE
jgi:ACR3 family arsenite efflux pump ArsB